MEDIPCDYGCHSSKDKKTSVYTTNKILILELKLFIVGSDDRVRKINNLTIKNLDKEILVINSKRYKVVSALFHHGDSIELGHYTSMLRVNDCWLRVDDSHVNRTSWPENSKDVYLIFLEEICQQQALTRSCIQNDFVEINKSIGSNKRDYERLVESNNNKVHKNSFVENKSITQDHYVSYVCPNLQKNALLIKIHC